MAKVQDIVTWVFWNIKGFQTLQVAIYMSSIIQCVATIPNKLLAVVAAL